MSEPNQLENGPTRRLKSPKDMALWVQSASYREFVSFLSDLGNSVIGVEIPGEDEIEKASDSVRALRNFLVKLRVLVEDIPPLCQPMRFGNKAFKTWLERVEQEHHVFLESLLGPTRKWRAKELSPYLMNSFGNGARIDYGTGHEANFCMFLLCLVKLGVLEASDKRNTVLIIFKEYLETMRTLEKVYMLEPAGSRGVWGLDDYHFMPFYWGAFQLELQESIRPADITDIQTVLRYCDKFLYLGAIKFILETKKGAHFAECSPMLYDISGVHSWKKIGSGLMKMYEAEVLQKFPIVQHFLFGDLIKLS